MEARIDATAPVAPRAILRPRLRSALAVGLAGATIAAVVISLLVWLARGMLYLPVSFGRSPVGVLGLVVSPICYAAVGGILAARVPRNPIGWLFLAMGVALGSMLPVNLVVAAAHESLRPASALVTWLAWARTTLGTPVVLAAAVVAVHLFPDGRVVRSQWRASLWLAVVAGIVLAVTTAVDPVGLVTYPSIANPLAAPYTARDVVDAVRGAAVIALVVAALAAIASLVVRYRAGDPILRAQLRWILLAAAMAVAAAIPFVIVRYVLRVTDSVGELTAAVAQISACALPLSAAFAMSRYRLWDIDVVIGRTLVYLPLMAALGGMYTAGIALFQRLFVAMTGSESEVAVVMTILVVASVFTPLRHALELTVDRRFPTARPTRGQPAGDDGGTHSATVETDHMPPPRPMPASGAPARVRLLAVAPDGTVACPLAEGRTIVDCLRCPRLIATAAEPEVTVVCQPELTGVEIR